jgi:hypothetical protein
MSPSAKPYTPTTTNASNSTTTKSNATSTSLLIPVPSLPSTLLPIPPTPQLSPTPKSSHNSISKSNKLLPPLPSKTSKPNPKPLKTYSTSSKPTPNSTTSNPTVPHYPKKHPKNSSETSFFNNIKTNRTKITAKSSSLFTPEMAPSKNNANPLLNSSTAKNSQTPKISTLSTDKKNLESFKNSTSSNRKFLTSKFPKPNHKANPMTNSNMTESILQKKLKSNFCKSLSPQTKETPFKNSPSN